MPQHLATSALCVWRQLTSSLSPSLFPPCLQSVQLFVSTPLSPLTLDSHIAAVQHVIGTCLRHHQLQSELYCQVLRQLAGHEDPSSCSVLQVSRLSRPAGKSGN